MGLLIQILLKISPALEAGKSLQNAAGWSNVAQASHALFAVLGFLLLAARYFNYDIPLSNEQLTGLAGALASVGGTVSSYLHVATRVDKGLVR
jgi:hypothetical protein